MIAPLIFKLVLLGALKYWLVPFSDKDRSVLCDLVCGVRKKIASMKQNSRDKTRREGRDMFSPGR